MSNDLQLRIESFYRIRNIPYLTGGSHNISDVITTNTGNCASKSALLKHELSKLGIESRLIVGRYTLRSWPPEVKFIPDQIDYHFALEVLINSQWVLVDAAYDPSISSLGFKINEWDGINPTGMSENCTETKVVGTTALTFDKAFEEHLQNIRSAFEANSAGILSYTKSFNQILSQAREMHTIQNGHPVVKIPIEQPR